VSKTGVVLSGGRGSRCGLAVVVCALAFALESPAATPAAPATDLLDVVQVGNGGAPLSNAATATFVVPLLSDGATGTPIALPTAGADAQHPFGISGSATSEGALELSGDGNFLTLAGYGATPGTTGPGGGSINGTTSSEVPRVIARVDGAGDVDTSTALTDAFSASNVRGAVTSDGSHFWVTGDGGSTTGGSVKNASIVYASSLGASTSTGLTSSPKQGRVPVIAGGNLYMSTSKSPGPGIFQVGSGLPTATGQSVASIGAEADPYGFVLLKLNPASPGPDTLYAADGTGGGIFKYSLIGSSWIAEGSVPGPALGALTGKVEGSAVQLYATSNDGLDVLAFSDAGGAGAPISSGSLTTLATAPLNTVYRGIAFAPTGQLPPPPSTPAPIVSLTESALGATISDPFNPTLDATVSDESVAAGELALTATSSNQAVVPDSNIALIGSGGSRAVMLNPVGVGTATITITATTPYGVSGHAQFEYGASAAATDGTSSYLYGAADASTAIDVGDGYFIVADDESSTLRLYSGEHSGFPVKTWNFDAQLGTTAELDLEWSARHGETIVWGGSESNSKSGEARPSAATIFATTVSGSGASTELTFAGHYDGRREDLLAWDAANGGALGFAAAAAEGVQPKQEGGFNIEGMEFGPGGSAVAYLGFRAPIVPVTSRRDALVVPVTNLLELATGAATHATFGTPLEWDLGGLGVREIRKNADDQYLVIAGSSGEGGEQHLYQWDGDPAHQPVASETALPDPPSIEGAWESIVRVPDPLIQDAPVPLIEDNGDTVWYGGATTGKDLPVGMEKDWADSFPYAAAAPPTLTPVIGGTLGSGGWYVSDVTVSWEVAGRGSGCAPTTLSSDTTGTVLTCSSSSAAGTTTKSVTIKLDKTKPRVSFAGDAGSYAVTQTVAIACSASDPTPGSGLASSSCPSVNAPAWSLGLGAHTLSASATDNAGNTQVASAGFTVTVTSASLCTLTDQFVQGSSRYVQLGALGRAVVDLLVRGDCALLTQIAPKLAPSQKAAFIAAYAQAAQALASSGWLTPAQASVLGGLAGGL
jgi:hypothetical protein